MRSFFSSNSAPARFVRLGLVISPLVILCSPPSASGHADLLLLIEGVTKRIQTSPAQADLYLLRGELYRAHADWKLAEADYDRAAQLDPKLAAIDLARAKLLCESGRDPDARRLLDRYLSLQPDDVDGLVARGQLLARSGEPSGAVADFTRAISRAATPLPDYFLQRARAQAATGDLAQALDGLDQGLQRLGPQVALQLYAIELECARKHFDRALARLETISSGSERKEKWLARRGEILALADQREEARQCFSAALASIESLPPRQRSAPAMAALQKNVVAALNGLEEATPFAGRDKAD